MIVKGRPARNGMATLRLDELSVEAPMAFILHLGVSRKIGPGKIVIRLIWQEIEAVAVQGIAGAVSDLGAGAEMADKLRVEVTDSVNSEGGLAEIEYWRSGHNLARKRRVKVSAVWENNPRCSGDTLTDGITTSKDHQVGYWLMPNGVTGWAEVSLNVRD